MGWTPKVILSTPLSMLEWAIAGKVDFVKQTNPWGSGGDDKPDPDPAKAAQNVLEAFLNHPTAKPLPSRKKKKASV